MFTQTPLVLFAAWTGIALALTALSLVMAHLGRQSLPARLPALITLYALLLVPAALAVALAPLGAPAWSGPAGLLFPVLCLCAAWLQAHALFGAPLPARLLALPVHAANILLGVVWGIRLTESLSGLDLGLPAGVLSAGYAITQTGIGHTDAFFLPVFVHLPILLPPWRTWSSPAPWLVLLLAAAPCAVFLFLWGRAMPLAWEIARTYRDNRPSAARPTTRPVPPLGLRYGPSSWGPSWPAVRERHRDALLELEPSSVLFMAEGGLLADDFSLRRLEEEADWARGRNLEVTVAALPARTWLSENPALAGLAEKMRALHRRLAERVRPTTLVLWWEPILLGAERLPVKPHPRQWAEAIAESARALRLPFPRLRLAVCLASPRPEALELLDLLAAPDFPLDEIGFSATPYLAPLEGPRSLASLLEHIQAAMDRAGSARALSILRAGCAPAPVGGEQGQAGALAFLLSWASARPKLRTIVIHSLASHDEDLGLITPTGRRRAAFSVVRGRTRT